MKVTVVVPVYNPGSHIDDCIASLLAQTMAPADRELIFVDDGSTDGTGERLDRLAAEHGGVTTIHIPNSGWPGRPRNIGLDRARGDYVLFVDNDDWLDPEALARLHQAALRDEADIVIGKVVGHGKGVPRELFRRNRSGAQLARDPILSLLTPHKLFRRDFVEREGLRFPEGRRRLEDHAFVLPAYFAARSITILSDHPIYHWVTREDGTNASVRPLSASYFDDVADVLDLVEQRTSPGAFRDRMLAHWYRSKLLLRLGSRRLLDRPREQWDELFSASRALAIERFDAGVTATLAATLRVRARLLVAGRLDGLEALAQAESAFDPAVRLESATWEDGVLRLALTATPVTGDGDPLPLCREDGRLRWVLPEGLPGAEAVTPADRDVEDELARSSIRVHVRRRDGGEEYALPARTEVTLDGAGDDDGEPVVLRLATTAELDPATAVAEAGPLPAGVWDLYAELAVSGIGISRRLSAGDAEVPRPALLGEHLRAAIPYVTVNGKLSLDLDATTKPLFGALRPRLADAQVASTRGGFAVRLGLAMPAPAGATRDATLALRRTPEAAAVIVPARLAGAGATTTLEALVPRDLRAGAWALSAALGTAHDAPLRLRLDVAADGTATLRRSTSRLPSPVEALAPRTRLRRRLRRIGPLRATVRAVRRVRALRR